MVLTRSQARFNNPLNDLPNELLELILFHVVYSEPACISTIPAIIRLIGVNRRFRSVALNSSMLWYRLEWDFCHECPAFEKKIGCGCWRRHEEVTKFPMEKLYNWFASLDSTVRSHVKCLMLDPCSTQSSDLVVMLELFYNVEIVSLKQAVQLKLNNDLTEQIWNWNRGSRTSLKTLVFFNTDQEKNPSEFQKLKSAFGKRDEETFEVVNCRCRSKWFYFKDKSPIEESCSYCGKEYDEEYCDSCQADLMINCQCISKSTTSTCPKFGCESCFYHFQCTECDEFYGALCYNNLLLTCSECYYHICQECCDKGTGRQVWYCEFPCQQYYCDSCRSFPICDRCDREACDECFRGIVCDFCENIYCRMCWDDVAFSFCDECDACSCCEKCEAKHLEACDTDH